MDPDIKTSTKAVRKELAFDVERFVISGNMNCAGRLEWVSVAGVQCPLGAFSLLGGGTIASNGFPLSSFPKTFSVAFGAPDIFPN